MAKINFLPARDIPNLAGKAFLLTGGTSGLGAGCVQTLVQPSPSHTYFTGRSTAKANELIKRIHQKTPHATVTCLDCDLTSFASVQALARRFLSESSRLDFLICNAGIVAGEADTTRDGYEK